MSSGGLLITYRLREVPRDATAWLRRLQVRSDGGRIRQIPPPKLLQVGVNVSPTREATFGVPGRGGKGWRRKSGHPDGSGYAGVYLHGPCAGR
jgi:hypothetical protein